MSPIFMIPFRTKKQQEQLLSLGNERERIPFMEKLFHFLKNLEYMNEVPLCTTDTLATMNQLSILMDGEWRGRDHYQEVIPFLGGGAFF